ncbi:hypothetical protein [Brevundimonas nasdae]|uniref:Uncharacterized protein n=1 Tax=Brevundimonas nasdae TaxID=172043 RepID=A0ACD4VIN4_9CAUL|nr:hypothetical protein [Brevundimonas nasdae]WOB77666.1 hypothetical protein PZA08_10005 [Brevundimonas nasdae]
MDLLAERALAQNKGDLGRPPLSGRLTRQYPGLWPCCGVSLGVVPTRTCLLIIHEGKPGRERRAHKARAAQASLTPTDG